MKRLAPLLATLSPPTASRWQVISQWVWNLRLELGHHLLPEPLRTTEFASARPVANEARALQAGYGLPQAAVAWKAGRFAGEAFPLQSDGRLCCPAGKVLHPTEQRPEADGSLRVVYAARIADCRACPLREQCQWHGKKTTRPRRVSLVFPRLRVGSAPVLWRDWSLRQHRRSCMQLLRRQRVQVQQGQDSEARTASSLPTLSRAQRAHYRLSFAQRLAPNARASSAGRLTITLFGMPEAFSAFLGLSTA